MAEERSATEVAEAMLAAMQTGDIEGVGALIHEDVEVLEPDSLFYGGTHRGRAAFFQGVVGAIMEKAGFEIHGAVVRDAGDVVVATIDLEFTSRETGRSVRMPFVEIYTVTDGQISRLDVFPKDTKRLMEILPDSGTPAA